MLAHFLPLSHMRLPSERKQPGKRYSLRKNPGKSPIASLILQASKQKGQGLVELAIVIPLLVVIVIGVLDLGRMYFTVITINNAAREGARYVTMHPSDLENAFSGTRSTAIQETQNTIINLQLSDVSVFSGSSMSCPDSNDDDKCDSGFPIRVEVTATFEPILWPDTLTFTRRVEMMVP